MVRVYSEAELTKGPLTRALRRSRKPRPAHQARLLEARSANAPTTHDAEPFGEREFASVEDFFQELHLHERDNFVKYMTRDSESREAEHKRETATRVKKGLPVDDAFLQTLLPESMPFAFKTVRCIHGVTQKPRGKEKRYPATSKYTSCEARITLRAVRLDNGRFVYRTMHEVARHNHKCNAIVYNAYLTGSLIEDRHLFIQIRAMIHANAPTKNICDVIGMLTGKPFTAQQLANFKRDHLGGNAAFENLRFLVTKFASFLGASCLVIDDESGRILAIVFQSSAQRAICKLWGDNLICDFTHNTNNAGYYLGSLMVTTATGKGVSVCDFLCVEQSTVMMERIFEHFIRTNPGVVQRVRSIVIDKDYTEWHVLRRLFSESRILLCQFHVLKCFIRVVTDRKYGFDSEMRDAVLHIVRSMVYAPTIPAFDVQVQLLHELLHDYSPAFLKYMHDRWYSCRQMWSDCERGTVFTALNTTSNRLEAAWNQLKKLLGRKLRIDLCVESIFAYQTAALRREIKLISRSESSTMLRLRADPFIRGVCRAISDYCCNEVMSQWNIYAFNAAQYAASVVETTSVGTPRLVAVASLRSGGQTYTVDCEMWSCTCSFATTSALPCRHVILTTRDVAKLDELPLQSVGDRWLMTTAASLQSALRAGVAEIQSLRTALMHMDPTLDVLVQDGPVQPGSTLFTRSVAHVRLRKGERSEHAVMDNLEKRRAVRAEFEVLTTLMMGLATPLFRDRLLQLRRVITGVVEGWTGDGDADLCGDVHGLSDSGEMDGIQVTAWVDQAVASLCPDDANEDADDGIRSCRNENQVDPDDDSEDAAPAPPFPATEPLDDDHVTPAHDNDTEVQNCVDVGADGHEDGILLRLHLSSRANDELTAGADLASMHLNPRIPNTTRRQRSAVAVYKRLSFVHQTSTCPIGIDRFVWAARWMVGVGRIMDMWTLYPLRFSERCLTDRSPSVRSEVVDPGRFLLNFTIPLRLLTALSSALRTHTVMLGHMTSLTGPRMEYVASITSSCRSFTRSNLASLRAFYDIKDKCMQFRADIAWVKQVGSESSDEQLRANSKAVVAAASTFALNSTFSIWVPTRQHTMQLEWADVIGHLAGQAHVMPVVLAFSLHLLARDFADVHVVDPVHVYSPTPVPAPPSILLEVTNLVVFPVIVAENHWCVVNVVVRENTELEVYLYDPLMQPDAQESLVRFWELWCCPFMTRWSARDGCVSRLRFVHVTPRPKQTDLEGSGIYILMQALDFMGRRGVFNSFDAIPPASVIAGRHRCMWRIVCDSQRGNALSEGAEAEKIMDVFREYTARQGPHSAAA